VTLCCHVNVCYFACSMFACNPVQLSLESVEGNLLTYLLSTVHKDVQRLHGLKYREMQSESEQSTVPFTWQSVNKLKMCKYVFFTGRMQTTFLHRHMHAHICNEAKTRLNTNVCQETSTCSSATVGL